MNPSRPSGPKQTSPPQAVKTPLLQWENTPRFSFVGPEFRKQTKKSNKDSKVNPGVTFRSGIRRAKA